MIILQLLKKQNIKTNTKQENKTKQNTKQNKNKNQLYIYFSFIPFTLCFNSVACKLLSQFLALMEWNYSWSLLIGTHLKAIFC